MKTAPLDNSRKTPRLYARRPPSAGLINQKPARSFFRALANSLRRMRGKRKVENKGKKEHRSEGSQFAPAIAPIFDVRRARSDAPVMADRSNK